MSPLDYTGDVDRLIQIFLMLALAALIVSLVAMTIEVFREGLGEPDDDDDLLPPVPVRQRVPQQIAEPERARVRRRAR